MNTLIEFKDTTRELEEKLIDNLLNRRTASTRSSYRTTIRQFREFCGCRLNQVDDEDMQAYIDQFSPRTANQKLSALRTLFRYLEAKGYVTDLEWLEFVEAPKFFKSVRERMLEPDQVATVIMAAAEGRDRTLVKFLYETGCRISEAVNLRWPHVKILEDGCIEVELRGKGHKTRVNTISNDSGIVDDILSLPRRHGGWVFNIKRSRAWEIFKAAAEKAGVPASSPHWMRHSHISHSLEGGAPVNVVRESVGHSSLNTTSEYAHKSADQCSGSYLPRRTS